MGITSKQNQEIIITSGGQGVMDIGETDIPQYRFDTIKKKTAMVF
jgi:hypothetical protein